MSWNGANPNAPNWGGISASEAAASVGDLYIVPDPPSIAENPSIGLEQRNEVPLPTAYKDFSVDDLNAVTINGNPNYDASNWWRFPANGNVTATLGPFDVPQYDISGFEQISCVTLNTTQNVECGNTINAVLGNLGALNCPDILMSPGDKVARLDVYGSNLLAGNNVLYVEGGTTLTGGGVVHGTTIGALNVGGIDTVRIDVLPAGIDITSATFVATTAAGAASLTAGGALALAGGSYISYNSDQHYFTNTSAGNDFTDIYVGNIHAADGGSAPLRINDAGRGVELANVNSMTMTTQLPIANWSNATNYAVGTKAKYSSVYYNALFPNLNLQPNIPIPAFSNASNYAVNNIVFVSGEGAFRCIIAVLPPPLWSALTQYGVGDKVERGGSYYNALFFHTNVDPSDPTIPAWNSGTEYLNTEVVSYSGSTYRCVGFPPIGTAPLPPIANWLLLFAGTNTSDIWAPYSPTALSPPNANWTLIGATNAINQVWAVFNPYVANITGDDVSNITIGKITAPVDVLRVDATTTNFSGKDIENVKTLTLTSTIGSPWNSANPYAEGDVVEYENGNWVSQFGVNQQNTPLATLQDWNTSGFYAIGAVRYYATNNNAYICILGVFGLSMPTPDTDPSHWSVFQVGSNGEDVWFPTTAPVQSAIVGDRVSVLEIGTIACLSDGGSYLEITPDPENDANGIVQSAGALALLGDQGVQIGATNNDVNIIAVVGGVEVLSVEGGVAISGNTLVGLEASVGGVFITGETDVYIAATTGSITLTSDGASSITSSANSLTLSSAEATSITSTANAVNLTGFLGVNINSPEAISLTSSASDVNITAGASSKVIVNSTLDLTNKNVINANTITGQGALTLATTGATNLNLSPATGGVIVGNKNLSMATINAITNCIGMSSDNALAFTANNGNVNLTATGSGNRILLNSDTSLGNRTLFNFTGTNVGGIFGLTTQPLNLVGQQTTPAVTIRGSLTMWATASVQGAGNSISGVTTLNGRNLFSYGNFYNTATQTLGAINTATRIQMNTSANNNLITLDSVTNIGRLTFTNAGVYQVSWSGYLLHGSGGNVKSVIWIRLNGTDVAGSGKTENNDNQLNETNLASTSLVSVTAGQYIEFYWAASGTGVPLTAVAASAPYPATPSFACSITIVG